MKIKNNYLLASLYVIYLLPIWLNKYFPSGDGPSHLYICKVMIKLLSGDPIYAEYFTINMMPFANWTSYVILLILYQIFPLVMAEKILLTIYLGLLILALKYLINSQNKHDSIWILPIYIMSYNSLLFQGFYNFYLGVPILLYILGFWWRRRVEWSIYNSTKLLFLLLILSLTHCVPYGIAVMTIAIMSIIYYRSNIRKISLIALSIIPSILVLKMGMPSEISQNIHFKYRGLSWLIVDLIQMRYIPSFNTRISCIFSSLLGYIVWGAFVLTIYNKIYIKNMRIKIKLEDNDYLYIPLIICVIMYIIMPNHIGSGGAITSRLCYICSLMVLPLISDRIIEKAKNIFVPIMIVITIANVYLYNKAFIRVNSTITEYMSGLKYINKGSTIAPLNISRRDIDDDRIQTMVSAINYYGIDGDIIIIGNAAASYDYFPVSYSNKDYRDIYRNIIYKIDAKKMDMLADSSKYLIAFGNDAEKEVAILKYYELIYQYKKVWIYKSKQYASSISE